MSKVIAVANNKGGVGKTTTVAALAYAWSAKGYKVLLVDLDSQANLTLVTSPTPLDEIEHTIKDPIVYEVEPTIIHIQENLDLIPCTLDFSSFERDVAGLILWAPYASSYDIYNNIMNIFHGPVKLMVRYQMDSYKYIRDVNCPVMIFASDSDELIPFQSSRDLFANAGSSSADFVTVSGLSHGDFLLEDMVLEDSIDFIKKLVSDI